MKDKTLTQSEVCDKKNCFRILTKYTSNSRLYQICRQTVVRFSLVAISVAVNLIMVCAYSHAEKQGRESGGGDTCENRIKVIRDDIKTWINNEGHKDLDFSILSNNSENYSDYYEKSMLTQINRAKIQCVSEGDTNYPVAVNSTLKICRFDKTKELSQINCDLNKFLNLTESNQYILIHHELAGLANIEIPNKDDSEYSISNQISDYFISQTIKKLAIKKVNICVPNKQTNKMHTEKGDSLDIYHSIVGCKPTDTNEIQNTYWFIPKRITRSSYDGPYDLNLEPPYMPYSQRLLLFIQPPNTKAEDAIRISKMYSYGSTETFYDQNEDELCEGKITGGVNHIGTSMSSGWGKVIWDVSRGIAQTGTSISIRMETNEELAGLFEEFKESIIQHREFYKTFVSDHPIALVCKNYKEMN
ncbi:MAG: hypothetical protein ABL927_00650 [Bdellovibrionales bacterium]